MEFFKQFTDVLKHDELIGGKEPLEIFNIKVNANVKRGDLLAAENFQGTFALATAADTAKVFAVAVTDFEKTDDKDVTAGYVRGTFHREKLNPNDETILTALEGGLRRQNILLKSIKPYHQPEF